MWSFDYSDYLEMFRKVRSSVGEELLVPYQRRHSGASIDRAERHRSFSEVQKRGRWMASGSVSRYEKHKLWNDSLQKHPRTGWLPSGSARRTCHE